MTNHIKSLHIKTYRGIRDLQIDNIGSVNILVGDNNTGKTSVLEAIQLLCCPNEYNLVQIARQREKYRMSFRMGLNFLDSVLFLFNATDNRMGANSYYICVSGTIHNAPVKVRVTGNVTEQLVASSIKQKSWRLASEVPEETPTFLGVIESSDEKPIEFEVNNYTRVTKSNDENHILRVNSVQTIDHIVENAFSRLIKHKDIKDKAVEVLKKFDETIADIRYINNDSSIVPIIENSNGDYIPLSLYGDGMKKALTMLKAIVGAEGGVVLIDEFETALHTDVMCQVFKFMMEAAKELGVQLFLTTHSIEAVDKLLESAGEHVSELRVVRLKKKESMTIAKVTNGVDALKERKEYNMELRI